MNLNFVLKLTQLILSFSFITFNCSSKIPGFPLLVIDAGVPWELIVFYIERFTSDCPHSTAIPIELTELGIFSLLAWALLVVSQLWIVTDWPRIWPKTLESYKLYRPFITPFLFVAWVLASGSMFQTCTTTKQWLFFTVPVIVYVVLGIIRFREERKEVIE